MKVYSIIPARSGSKGMPGKNVRLLCGYPLIAYSIWASKLVPESIERTIVSSDSQEIANTAHRYGAEVPFLRPEEISQDESTDLEFFKHAIAYFNEIEGNEPDLLVHLRPTTPLRMPSEIEQAITLLKDHKNASSLRSAHEFQQPLQKMFQMDDNGYLTGIFPQNTQPGYHNLPRQSFPKTYCPDGYVDIVKPEVIKRTGLLHGLFILKFETVNPIEVERLGDFGYLEYLIEKDESPVYKFLKENFPKEHK